MAKTVTVELPWLNGYQALLFKSRLDGRLGQRGLKNIPQLLEEAAEELLERGYEIQFHRFSKNRYRGCWVLPLLPKPPRTVILEAISNGNPVELFYITDGDPIKAILPLKERGRSFQAETQFGVRNYRWDRVISSLRVEKQWNPELHRLEISTSGFGPLTKYSSKLLTDGGGSRGEMKWRGRG